MFSNNIPQIIYDLDQTFGMDILTSPSGDLGIVSLEKRSQQRVVQRLMTNPGNYIWHTEYGAGLPAFVGEALSLNNYDQIKSLILSNMFLEDSVSQNPPPVIFIQPIFNGVFVQINYTMNPSLSPIVLSFEVNNI
jgi:hypothetical protein